MKLRLLALALLLLPCAAAAAQVGAAPSLVPAAATDTFDKKIDAKTYIARLEPAITLSEQQKQQIADILGERTKEVDEFLAKKNEKMEAGAKAMSAAYKTSDQEQIKKAIEDYQATMAPLTDIMKKYNEKLGKVITSEQKAALEDARLTDMIKLRAAPAKLTDAQMKKVKSIVKAIGGDPAERYAAISKAIDEVLTPEQKADTVKQRVTPYVMARLARAKLTPEQTQQIEKIVEQVAKDSTLDTRQVSEQSFEKAMGILTAEQKAAVKPKSEGGKDPQRQ